MTAVRKFFRSHKPLHSTHAERTDRALARAYRDAPTQATVQELRILESLGR